MFTVVFWTAALERAIRAGANVVITSLVVGDGILNVFTVDWGTAAGIFLGGVVVSVLMSLAADRLTGGGPALLSAEVLEDHPRTP